MVMSVSPRHCEERKRRSNPRLGLLRHGLLRFARNDECSCGRGRSPHERSGMRGPLSRILLRPFGLRSAMMGPASREQPVHIPVGGHRPALLVLQLALIETIAEDPEAQAFGVFD